MKRYIYNLEQVYFYIENGIRPIGIPKINPSSNRIYFIFGDTETKEVYSKWCTRKCTT